MPLILWAIGIAAAILIGRALLRQARRINSELHRAAAGSKERDEPTALPTLERDPVSGIYRPKSRTRA